MVPRDGHRACLAVSRNRGEKPVVRGAGAGVEWADGFRPSDVEHRNPIAGGRKAVPSNPRLSVVVRPARPGVGGTVTGADHGGEMPYVRRLCDSTVRCPNENKADDTQLRINLSLPVSEELERTQYDGVYRYSLLRCLRLQCVFLQDRRRNHRACKVDPIV